MVLGTGTPVPASPRAAGPLRPRAPAGCGGSGGSPPREGQSPVAAGQLSFLQLVIVPSSFRAEFPPPAEETPPANLFPNSLNSGLERLSQPCVFPRQKKLHISGF